MRDFLGDRRELPQGQSYDRLIIQNKITTKTNLIPSDHEESEGEILTSDEKNSYASYLAYLIYDYQLKLKYGSISLLTFLIMLSLDFGYAQEITKPEIMSLKIGDTIHEALWNIPLELHYFDGKRETIKLSALKGKVILFDFWSTTCPSCIEGIPKMEIIQKKFGKDIAVILVNSKRNKDTEIRIKKRFEVYKDVNNYVPTIPSLLDDELFTILFEHNTIPTIAWLDPAGKFLGNSFPSAVTDEQINRLIKGEKAQFIPKSNIENVDRLETSPLLDTTGYQFISAFSNFRHNYLSVYPNIEYKNGTSLFQIGNFGLSFLLNYAFDTELTGYSWNDYVIEPCIATQVKEQILATALSQNSYWYQLYSRDSLTMKQAQEIFKHTFTQNFKIHVVRKTAPIDLLKVNISNNIKRIKSKGSISFTRFQGINEEIFYQNYPLHIVLKNLFVFFDHPIDFSKVENLNVDIVIPEGFVKWTKQQKISFLADHGIDMTLHHENRTFPYLYHVIN